MKPCLLQVPKSPITSFSVRQDILPHFFNRRHYHPEVELILIEEGFGIQYIGDHVSEFKKGDILLIGGDLPHYWQCNASYFAAESTQIVKAKVVHFKEDFWGSEFLDLPENSNIKAMLDLAKRGLKVPEKDKPQIAALMAEMLKADDTSRLINLLQCLYTIAKSNELWPLSFVDFKNSKVDIECDRLNQIFQYAQQNYRDKITVKQVAQIAKMSEHSFCRYFKTTTGKTFTKLLQEIRVASACKLIIEGSLSQRQVCYESGFFNLTSFYRDFLRITGKTPRQYSKAYCTPRTRKLRRLY